MKQCPNCNFKTPRNNDLFCAICGANLKTIPDVSVCKHCGTELYPNARFCTKCGEQPSIYGPTMSAAGETDSEISISVMPGEEVPPESTNISANVQNETPAPDFLAPEKVRGTTKPSPAAPETLVVRCEVFEPTELTTKVFVDPPETVQFVQGEGAPSSRILSREEIRALGLQAMQVIPERVAHFAPLVGVNYRKIIVQNYKNHWGICTYRKDNPDDSILKFNCLLMLAPPDVLDSVVVHELCHILQHNHSEKFYAEVLRVLPDYWEKDKWLDDHGFILENVEDGYVFRSSVEPTP